MSKKTDPSRIAWTLDRIREFKSSEAVQRAVSAEFGVTRRQARRYQRIAYARLAAEDAEHVKNYRHEILAALRATYEGAAAAGDHQARIAVLREFAKVVGAHAPIAMTGAVAVGMMPVESRPVAELWDEIAQMIATNPQFRAVARRALGDPTDGELAQFLPAPTVEKDAP